MLPSPARAVLKCWGSCDPYLRDLTLLVCFVTACPTLRSFFQLQWSNWWKLSEPSQTCYSLRHQHFRRGSGQPQPSCTVTPLHSQLCCPQHRPPVCCETGAHWEIWRGVQSTRTIQTQPQQPLSSGHTAWEDPHLGLLPKQLVLGGWCRPSVATAVLLGSRPGAWDPAWGKNKG